MMRNANRFFLVFFFFIILSVPTYWLVPGKPSTQVSIIEGRVLGLPEKSYPTLKIALEYIQQGNPELAAALVWDLYTGGSLQDKFDGAATDQFPLRMPLIKFSKSVDRQIIKLVYAFTEDSIIPADMTSDLYIMLDEDALIYPPHTINPESFQIIDKRLENYKEIASEFPDINFYIYYIETLEFSQSNPLERDFPNADNGQSFEYFQTNLPDSIRLGTLPLESVDFHLENFYRTDHHWNTFGIMKGYNGIYELLSINYPNLPKKLTPTAMITFPGIEFLGTLARKTLYPIRGDAFTGFDAQFPECSVSDNGIEGDFDYRDEYLEGDYPTTSYISHYGLYFGTQEGILEYDCDTGSKRNILIIGDSYASPLVALIATQYEHTYFVDLRQVEVFSLFDFLYVHPVDDILISGGSNVVYLEPDIWMIRP